MLLRSLACAKIQKKCRMYRTQDLHVKEIVRLLSPRELKAQSPTPEAVNATVARSRERVIRILRQEDPRLLVVIGPCSIHDEKGALEYADAAGRAAKEFADKMEIVMRVYFEKPRTTIGWKGLINDPHLDGSQDIENGLKIARKLAARITGMGLPAATEFLDPIVPQYIADLITWAAIGARTTESQTHREMASGLSMPVGLKNGTDGSLQVAIDAMGAARHAHSFLGINEDGVTSIVRTTGQSARARRVARRAREDKLRRRKHPRGGGGLEDRKAAAGADGGLQPCKFGEEIRKTGGCLAQRYPAKNRRHAIAHRPDG
jgi:3-deoxy-7-phosphoheptulonate synthase